MPDAVEDLLGTRVARLAAPRCRRLLLAVALSGDLRARRARGGRGSGAPSRTRSTPGCCCVDGDRVRASHPLLAAAAKKRSRARERRELHRALAGAVADEELRALHLALATERARRASSPRRSPPRRARAAARGARAGGGAAGRARAAADAAGRRPSARERLLALAELPRAAGEQQRLTDLLAPASSTRCPRGALRARALAAAVRGRRRRRPIDDLERHLDARAGRERRRPGAARVRAGAEGDRPPSASAVERIREAEAWALEALPAARAPSRDVERLALYALAWARACAAARSTTSASASARRRDAAYYIAASPERSPASGSSGAASCEQRAGDA